MVCTDDNAVSFTQADRKPAVITVSRKEKGKLVETGRFRDIQKKLEATLDEYRYVHTLGVALTSAALAMRYETDVEKAELAGLLHDCAKSIPKDQQYVLCEKYGVELSEYEKRNPSLVHSKLGAWMAWHDYGVEDEDVLEAIRTHTTGKPDMSLLQKIVYVADLIEPHRDDIIPDIARIRHLAFTDIDEAVFITVEGTIINLAERGKEEDPLSRDTFEYYKHIHILRHGEPKIF